MRSRLALLCAFAAVVLASCSLINKFDELKPVKPDAGVGTAGSAGTAGTAGGGSGTGGEAGAGAGSGGTSGVAGGGNGGAPQDGLIVVSGQVAGVMPVQPVIAVLSPWTGVQLDRTNAKGNVRAIAYDGEQDLWFIFYAPANLFNVNATVSIGRFDLATGKFTDMTPAAAPLVPVPFDQNQFVVLNHRLMYVSARSATAQGMALLDTTPMAGGKPNVAVMGNPATDGPPAGTVVSALLAHPSKSAAGGTVTIVQQNQQSAECMPEADAGVPDGGTPINDCPIKVMSATVGSGATAPSYGASFTVGTARDGQWSAGWVSDGQALGTDYILLPPRAFGPQSQGSLYQLFSANLSMTVTPTPFPFPGPRIASTAFDPCRALVFAGELKTSQTITAIPTVSVGTPALAQEGKNVQHLTYEPFTKSLIMTFDDVTNPAFDAWAISGTETNPAFVQRRASSANPWNPPTTLVPKTIVVKTPLMPPCQ